MRYHLPRISFFLLEIPKFPLPICTTFVPQIEEDSEAITLIRMQLIDEKTKLTVRN
jgi:hypothetical protein